MSRDQPPPADDRREATRFAKEPGTDFAVIRQGLGEERRLAVHNESLGGLSLATREAASFQVGHEVDLVYAGTALRATVKHIQAQPDGTFLVGFQCRELS